MPLIGTSLTGINPLSLKAEIERAVAWPVDFVQINFVYAPASGMSLFGEFMIAHLAAWSNLPILVHYEGKPSCEAIKDAIACGADLVVLPAATIDTDLAQTIRESQVILGLALREVADLPRLKDYLPEFVYTTWGAMSPRVVYEAFSSAPHPPLVAHFQGQVLNREVAAASDLIVLDLFDTSAPTELVGKVSQQASTPISKRIQEAFPHGLPVPRDHERLFRLFENLDTRLPFIRQPKARS